MYAQLYSSEPEVNNQSNSSPFQEWEKGLNK
jgi:hypothetical protein